MAKANFKMPTILILNGPNLNMLGQREPHIYGKETHDKLMARCAAHGKKLGLNVVAKQSNHEGVLIDDIQDAGSCAGIILNAGGYTHTSVALRDAIASITTPVIEVHLSNTFARESFRHASLLSPVCLGVICGLGSDGYLAALDVFARRLAKV